MAGLTRWMFAAVLAAHGIAHLVGFALNWQLMTSPDEPFATTIFAGRWDVGTEGARVVGLLWLVAAGAFLAAAAAVAARANWAFGALVTAVVMSLVMCAVGWPAARIGLYVNLALAGLLLAGTAWGPAIVLANRHARGLDGPAGPGR